MSAKSPQSKRKTNREANGEMSSPTHLRQNTSTSTNCNTPQCTVILATTFVRDKAGRRSDKRRHLPRLDPALPTSAKITDRRFLIVPTPDFGAGPVGAGACRRARGARDGMTAATRPHVSCRNEGINLVDRVGAVRRERFSAVSASAMPLHGIGRMSRDRQPPGSCGTFAHANADPRA